METIGQTLKAEREKQKLTIAEVALTIKTKQLYVRAIEENRFDELIAPIYARGFIKLYAELLGLDPQPLLNLYQAPPDEYDSEPVKPIKRFKREKTAKSAPAPDVNTDDAVANDHEPLFSYPNFAAKEESSFKIYFHNLFSRLSVLRRKHVSFHNKLLLSLLAYAQKFKSSLRESVRARQLVFLGLACLLLIGLAVVLHQVRICCKAKYLPPSQAGYLQPAPEPYP